MEYFDYRYSELNLISLGENQIQFMELLVVRQKTKLVARETPVTFSFNLQVRNTNLKTIISEFENRSPSNDLEINHMKLCCSTTRQTDPMQGIQWLTSSGSKMLSRLQWRKATTIQSWGNQIYLAKNHWTPNIYLFNHFEVLI